ncbi:hypothetical protein AVEN_67191-1 [Araneus ventricosus]|uniref:Uncharacterized protein n=1 Tax=Araneus ventricosus TaxID=182803 RepID=A0A4Y2VD76_ARAVE|nr:hypothetical protein AVEN_67191-1 [Araneus ventricosus]
MPFWPRKSIRFPIWPVCVHPRRPLCSLAFGRIARGSGRLNGSKDGCEFVHVSLREHGNHFLPSIPIQLTGNPLGSELGVCSGVNVNVEHSHGAPYHSSLLQYVPRRSMTETNFTDNSRTVHRRSAQRRTTMPV